MIHLYNVLKRQKPYKWKVDQCFSGYVNREAIIKKGREVT